VAYCNRLSVKMASENSSKDKFETLHGPERPYLFEPTTKPGAVRAIYSTESCRS